MTTPRESDATEREPGTEIVQADVNVIEKAVVPRPDGMTDDEEKQLQQRAVQLIQEAYQASGGDRMDVADRLANLGMKSQHDAAREMELMRSRMGDLISAGGASAEISKGLTDLRSVLREIDPHAENRGLIQRAINAVPLLGKSGRARRLVEKIALRYEPVAKQVSVLESSLRGGRDMLVRDSIELRKIFEDVESQRKEVVKNAYFGQLVMDQLNEELVAVNEDQDREVLLSMAHNVSMRVQDLRTMNEVCMQYLVSLEMGRENNSRLAQAVDRTVTLGSNVVMVGLAIQTALIRQQRVLEANTRTREFLGNLIAENAASIKRHTTEIGDAYNSPVIALDKLEQAHGDLVEAIETAARLREEGIANAHENAVRLSRLSTEIQAKALQAADSEGADRSDRQLPSSEEA